MRLRRSSDRDEGPLLVTMWASNGCGPSTSSEHADTVPGSRDHRGTPVFRQARVRCRSEHHAALGRSDAREGRRARSARHGLGTFSGGRGRRPLITTSCVRDRRRVVRPGGRSRSSWRRRARFSRHDGQVVLERERDERLTERPVPTRRTLGLRDQVVPHRPDARAARGRWRPARPRRTAPNAIAGRAPDSTSLRRAAARSACCAGLSWTSPSKTTQAGLAPAPRRRWREAT